MKLFILTLVFTCGLFAQQSDMPVFYERYLKAQFENAGVGGADSSASILNRTYVAATNDTTESISTRVYKDLYISIQSKDSASIHIKYQQSLDNVTWGVLTTLDSLSTGSNVGAVKTVFLADSVKGVPFIRFIIDPTAFRLGTSTPTYTAYFLGKR